MAPRGRKRKAEAAMVAAAEKQERLANSGEGMEETTVVIEHCQALRLEAPELPVKVNPTKPRRGSFEVTLLRPDGSSAELWTGIKKGPPRKLKFPEPQEVVEELKKYLS
ncbi:Selenoprotein H [Macaca fascicularis]|uniref:Selenoprotein H n=1 Tax=Macaca fascicularis TaxID=9541 RepID=G7PQ28_MACFA|nr:Selenoprotein H [Macaca fascicularis]